MSQLPTYITYIHFSQVKLVENFAKIQQIRMLESFTSIDNIKVSNNI